MEAQFHLKNLTISTTKLYTVLTAFPPDVVSKLPIKVLGDKELKSSIVSIYEKTKPVLLGKLMKACILSGRPSVYSSSRVGWFKPIGLNHWFKPWFKPSKKTMFFLVFMVFLVLMHLQDLYILI